MTISEMTISTPHPRGSFGHRLIPCLTGLAGTCLALSGCAGTKPLAYSGIASSQHMKANDTSDRLPYAYETAVNWRDFSRLLIEPVVVYHGEDAQFGKIPEEGKLALARYMEEQFTEKLSPPFELTATPKPRTLRLRLTLTGAKPTMPVAGTFSRIDVAGGPYNMVQAIRGKEGSLTGSVFYAVEIYDATTNRLLAARIVKQYPAALNMKATFGALTAAKTGIRKGAEELARELSGMTVAGTGAISSAASGEAEAAVYDPEASPKRDRASRKRVRRAGKIWNDGPEATVDEMADETADETQDGGREPDYPICGKGVRDQCRQPGGE